MKYEIQLVSKVSAYIDHHMKLAGDKMPLFTEAAIEAMHYDLKASRFSLIL